MGAPRARRSGRRGATLTVSTIPTKLARQQIAALRGKTKASFLLAVEDIRRRGCAAAGVRLAGEALSGICRLDLYGASRLLTVFEAPDRCVLLLVAEHTRSANPYRLLYAALGIDEPKEPRDQAIVLRYRRTATDRPRHPRAIRARPARSRPRAARRRRGILSPTPLTHPPPITRKAICPEGRPRDLWDGYDSAGTSQTPGRGTAA